MRVLTIDTATRRAMVAAVANGDVLAVRAHENQTAHAERLFGMVDDVLAEARWSCTDVDLFAVGMGPGSFTGVRVGMAAAKGLGFALGIPLVGVISLAAMAHAGRPDAGTAPIVAMLDAKKGEVFVACYGVDGSVVAAPEHIPRDQVSAWLEALAQNEAPCLVGEVVHELRLTDLRVVSRAGCELPEPASTAALAEQGWGQQAVDQSDTLEPLYVRPPDITMPRKRSIS